MPGPRQEQVLAAEHPVSLYFAWQELFKHPVKGWRRRRVGGKALAAVEEERESIECGVGIGWARLGLQGLPGTHGLVPGTLPCVGTYASLWTFLHQWHPAAVPTVFGAAVPPCLWAELNQTVPAYSCNKKGLQRVGEEDAPWWCASSEQHTLPLLA